MCCYKRWCRDEKADDTGMNDLGVQTAILIRDSNVIERNKKDAVNNQFWADNRNACGLNISDIEYMTDNDKEIVQRNKNIVLDMGDGKIC